MPKLSYMTGLPPMLAKHGFEGPYLLKITDGPVGSMKMTTIRVVMRKSGIYDGEDCQNPTILCVKCEDIEGVLDEAIAAGIDPWNPPPEETLGEALERIGKKDEP